MARLAALATERDHAFRPDRRSRRTSPCCDRPQSRLSASSVGAHRRSWNEPVASIIYKFCPPNRFTLENLAAGTIFCRHPGEFNDPFEFWAMVHEGVPELRDD